MSIATDDAATPLFEIQSLTEGMDYTKNGVFALDTKINSMYQQMNTNCESIHIVLQAMDVKLNQIQAGLKPKSKCIFCPQLDTHHSNNCANYTSVSQRTVRLTELGICVRCLELKDDMHSCNFTCVRCKEDHHILMCDVKKRRFTSNFNLNS